MPKKAILTLVVTAMLTLSACVPIAVQEDVQVEAQQPEAATIERASDVPRMSAEEAKAHFDDGTAVFVDSRSRSSYDAEHIEGALPSPEGAPALDNSIPKDQLIITYCT